MSSKESGIGRVVAQNKWFIFVLCAAAYCIVWFHRVSTGVIVADLKREFGVTAAQLGLFSSIYFYVYALVQFPVGLLTDRFGAKKVILTGLVVAVGGTALFSLSQSLSLCMVARGITSLGVAATYVPTLGLLMDAFGVGAFSTATGLLFAVGNLGAIFAATPLALSVQAIGWRGSFWVIAGVTAIIVLLILFFLRAGREGVIKKASAKTAAEPAAGSKANGPVWWALALLGVVAFFKYGPYMSYQGLWGIPFLTDVYHLARATAGNIIILISIGYIIGSVGGGLLTDRLHVKKSTLLLFAAAGMLISYIPLAFFAGSLSPAMPYVIALIMGIASGASAVLVYSLAPFWTGNRKGAGLGFLNTCSFFGGAVYQLGTGWIIDLQAHAGRPVALQYQAAFLSAFIGTALCLAGAIFVYSKAAKKEAEAVAATAAVPAVEG